MKRFALRIVLASACALALVPAAAASDLFLKFTDIKGESTDKDHKDWIEVLSYSWGASNSGSIGSGGGGGQGKVSFSDFSFLKLVDSSSPALFYHVASGKHIAEATFDVVKAGGNSEPFLQYKFTDVLISSYQVSGSTGSDVPVDSVSFAFGKVEMSFFPQDDKGGLGKPITAIWDVEKNMGSLSTSPVPEPSTWAMLIAGLAFVAFRGRRMVRSRTA